MGFLKFVIPFVGGALTVAAAGAFAKAKQEERSQNSIEIDAEFEEKQADETADSSTKNAE